MTTDVDWRELIDRSFGDGPDHPPVGDRLAAGRRALLRRRIVASAAIVAFGVVAAGGAWAALPSEAEQQVPAADLPDQNSDADSAGNQPDGDLVTMTESGWQVAPGWTVVTRVPNPMNYQPPLRSVGLELTKGSEHRFVLAAYSGDCCTSVHSTLAPRQTTLADWLVAAVSNQRDLDIANGDTGGEPSGPPVH